MDNVDLNHCIKVLRYWHKVEFFCSYDLQKQFDDKKITYSLYSTELKDERLPWASPDALRMAGGKAGKKYRYQLYLGMFDKSVIKSFAEAYFRDPQGECEAIDWQEREELEGSTCFASLSVDEQGIPLIDEISLSTLPWAMGHLKARRLNALTYQSYESSVGQLTEAFNRVFPYLSSEVEHPVVPLTGHAIQLVLEALFAWADFAVLDTKPIIAIRLYEVIPKKEKQLEHESESRVTVAKALPDKTQSFPVIVEEDDEFIPETSTDLNILNSFFIQDIELAISMLQKGKQPEALLRYVSGEMANRLDLNSPEGEQDIFQLLKPKYCNQGRWPANDQHLMSLMQQYAINRGFEVLSEGGLFSVNGPPGTGKTTMLRDMVADLMVKRAQVLSGLKNSAAAFSGKRMVTFSNGDTATIGLLKPELTGYEILVASANNAAVENISTELPLKKELGQSYHNMGYLKSVANKQLAEHGRDMKIQVLDDEHSAWGFMAVALGKKANRDKFMRRSITNSNGDARYNLPDGVDYQTLWQWRDNYKGITFQKAKQQFKDHYSNFTYEEQKYTELVSLWERLSKTDKETYCLTELALVEEAEKKLASLQKNVADERRDLASIQQQLERLEQVIFSHQALKPGWWIIFLGYRLWRGYHEQRREYHQNHIDLLQNVSLLEIKLENMLTGIEDQQTQLLTALKLLERKRLEYAQMIKAFIELKKYFSSPLDIEISIKIQDKATQRAALFQNQILNELRSCLFAAAMTLHEAWLAEVLKKGGKFGGNLVGISKLLSGNRVTSGDDILPLWQSLFMIVPVISSTFASIASQFKGLGAGDLGWLFIDEAGQAVPQQAVGAMLRCKRVMVVGDPLQIEPVFTTSLALVEGLAKMDFGEDFVQWAPSVTSVQRLADEANVYGTYLTVGEHEQWIGSPLRVHRRCSDPIFSIANSIAYENSMIHALDEPKDTNDYLLGCSGWLHVRGQVEGRQFVKSQALVVVQIIEHVITQTHTLPNIYIITPFREIKDKLKDLLINNTNLQLNGEQRWKYEKWVNDRVGTVHNFQGKEEETVIFVLGADHVKSGSAAWAASKPNLLNVAITRAKRRVYIIGDKQLWGRFQYFTDAAKQLDDIKLADMIESDIFV